jgi:PAS domain S-box-containing protein
MTTVAVSVCALTIVILYRASLKQQRDRLIETASSQARLIEAIAQFDKKHSTRDVSGDAFAATISQIKEAHKRFHGFGETGEFTLAKREGNRIVFLLSHRHADLDNPQPVPFISQIAEPMSLALSGKSGTIIGLDYRGERVLAAYEPVAELDLGIVAKIDMSEIRGPFIRAGLLASGCGFILILAGTILFFLISNPIVRKIEKSEEQYRAVAENSSDYFMRYDRNFRHTYANAAAIGATGLPVEEYLGKTHREIGFPQHLCELWEEHIQNVFDTGERSKIEFEVELTEGSRFLELQLNPEFSADGGVHSVIGISRDITGRKRAEEALVESEAKLHAITEAAIDYIMLLDVELRVQYVNRAEPGLSIDEIIGKPIYEFAPEKDQPRIKELLREALETGASVRYETEYPRPDGEVVHFESVVAQLNTGEKSDGLVVTSRDITERRRAEEVLHRYETIVSSSTDMLALLDPDFFYLAANQAYLQAFGKTRDDIIGNSVPKIFGDEFFNTIIKPNAERCLAGEEVHYQGWFEFPVHGRMYMDIAYFPYLNSDNEIMGFVVAGRDITERKESEEALRAAKENLELQVDVRTADLQRTQARLQEAQHIAGLGFLTWNLKTDEMHWSDEVYLLYGVDKQEAGPTIESTIELIHPDDMEYVQKNLDMAVKGVTKYNIDHRIVRPDGTVIWIHAQAKLTLDRDGNPEYLLGTVLDITERKEAEERHQQYQQRLKALASQLTIVEERERRRMAADLHDRVGQSLAFARIQIARTLKSGVDVKLATMLDELSKSIFQAAQDTRHLIFDLSSPLLNEIGLTAAISEWLEEQIGERYGLETELIENGWKEPLDDDSRAIVFRNVRELLTNVAKHAKADKVTVCLEDKADSLSIVVKDDGIGFDPREVSEALTLEGGYGLFSVRERMADLGGSLEIVSEPGKGCTAILTAPMNKK